jgi:hypothetical protein
MEGVAIAVDTPDVILATNGKDGCPTVH